MVLANTLAESANTPLLESDEEEEMWFRWWGGQWWTWRESTGWRPWES